MTPVLSAPAGGAQISRHPDTNVGNTQKRGGEMVAFLSAASPRRSVEVCPPEGTVRDSSQSTSNDQSKCGIVCQNWGNINFFALGNLNVSQNDINTITAQTHK